ncbi:MAG: cation:proton antiporter regulatory subunit [Mycobacterium sp.]
MDVNEVLLPGVGLRYEFNNSEGDRIGVIAKRSGDFEVVVYTAEDPDVAQPLFHLSVVEAEALAQILGAPRIAERFADLTHEVPGLDAGQVSVEANSPFVDRPLGDARVRTRTGASIVAVVRDEVVLPSPGPADILHSGDVLVVIGTAEGITQVEHIFDKG